MGARLGPCLVPSPLEKADASVLVGLQGPAQQVKNLPRIQGLPRPFPPPRPLQAKQGHGLGNQAAAWFPATSPVNHAWGKGQAAEEKNTHTRTEPALPAHAWYQGIWEPPTHPKELSSRQSPATPRLAESPALHARSPSRENKLARTRRKQGLWVVRNQQNPNQVWKTAHLLICSLLGD